MHQLHVCLPAGSGRTRLLYRMSLDFAGFARYLPFIDRFWKSLANQVNDDSLLLFIWGGGGALGVQYKVSLLIH